MARIPLLFRFEGGTREDRAVDSCWREEEEEEVTFFINVTVQGTVSRDCLRAEPRSDRMNWEINGL